MTVDQYVQLDWSPTVWAILQLVMALFTFAVVGLFVVMVYRAGEATAPVPVPAPAPADELEAPSDFPAVAPAVATAVDLTSVEPELTRV